MLKKVLALALAGAMVIGSMSMTAFGADEAVTRSISIGGLDRGDTVNFYKILSWEPDEAQGATKGAVNGWYFEAPFNTASPIQEGTDLGKAYLAAHINAENKLVLDDNMANDLARVLNTGSYLPINLDASDPTKADPVEESGGVATYQFTPDKNGEYTGYDGLYMAIITPADQDVIYNPVFVHIDNGHLVDLFTIIESSASYMLTSADILAGQTVGGAAKKSRVTLTKESSNDTDYTGDDGDTTAPYDTLDFTVKTTIPGYGDTFDWPVFKLTDKLNTMRLVYPSATNGTHTDASGTSITDTYKGSITVTVDGTEYVIDDASKYENDVFKITPADGQYEIEFKEDYLKTVHVPVAVQVDYKAVIQPGANTNVIKEKNTVQIEYSHDPSTESDSNHGGDKKYKKDITNHYTFSIDANNLVGPYKDRVGESGTELVKIAVDKDGNPIKSETKTYSKVTTTEYEASPLGGAEFVLYKSNEAGTQATSEIVGKATSDSAGRINFTGLDAGVYWLEETKAPAGYVKTSGKHKITITATMTEPTNVTEYTTDGKTWISEKDYNKLSDEAKKAYQSYTYQMTELETYSVIYGNDTTSYTFSHAHESDNGAIRWSIATSSEAPSSIHNAKGVELPSTGGIGTTLFYAGGAVLVLLAGVLLVSKRRVA